MFLSKIAGFHSLQTFYSTRATKSEHFLEIYWAEHVQMAASKI